MWLWGVGRFPATRSFVAGPLQDDIWAEVEGDRPVAPTECARPFDKLRTGSILSQDGDLCITPRPIPHTTEITPISIFPRQGGRGLEEFVDGLCKGLQDGRGGQREWGGWFWGKVYLRVVQEVVGDMVGDGHGLFRIEQRAAREPPLRGMPLGGDCFLGRRDSSSRGLLRMIFGWRGRATGRSPLRSALDPSTSLGQAQASPRTGEEGRGEWGVRGGRRGEVRLGGVGGGWSRVPPVGGRRCP